MTKRLVVQMLGVALAFLFVVGARAVLGARSELAMGDEVAELGDMDGALIHWRRAAKWHVPTSPYAQDALVRMEELAIRREEAGDTTGALRAWRSIRASILATRSFYVPHADLRSRVDRRIAELSEGDVAPMETLLAEAGAPGWAFFSALLGFLLFVLGVFLLASKGIDEEDRVVVAEARRYGALALTGFVLLAVALAF